MGNKPISVWDTSTVQIRLIEARDTAHIVVNNRHFALKPGETIDITPSLCQGVNITTLIVNTDSLKDNPSRLLSGKSEWLGRFEVYVDGSMAGSYLKRGAYIIGGKENIVASIDINVTKDVRKPTVMQLINQLQTVQGITDADKTDISKSHPHLIFKNGVTVHTWKNYAGVDHVFITDGSGKCVYGGYVGWAHSKSLQNALQALHNELGEYC